ncbi:MAG: porin [Rhodobacteraceae bacterium]|nr:porin [Paracoccaceae bacterium]MCF8513334.1 porin [Paracoccaceae bacterium]MCF8517766.1 porin [Paracoccaceae bacterium]
MKKILLATTVLAMSATVAAAEMTLSGSGVMGLNYNDGATAGSDKTTTLMETYISFSGSGETDGGLSFGMSATLGQYSTDDTTYVDDGTTLFISGAFGKLTYGDVSEADEVATLSDIGLTGIGTDNVAEALSGDSNSGVAHNVNYSYAAGDLSFSASANIGDTTAAAKNDSMAVGVKYTFGDYYVGLGYNATDIDNAIGARDGNTTSLFAGGKFGAVAVKAMYSDFSADAGAAADLSAWGLTADYKMDALTLSLAYSDNDFVANTKASYGIGAAYDLGGGAVVKGGIGSVNDVNRAQVGVSLSF